MNTKVDRSQPILHLSYAPPTTTIDRGQIEVRKEVAQLIENTDEAISIRETETDELVASARVLTDYHQYSMIYKAIVAESR